MKESTGSNKRRIYFYKDYFERFFEGQSLKVREKILWVLQLIQQLPLIPSEYLKHLEDTDGLFEIRIKSGNNQYRIFCFFDPSNCLILINAFQKKSKRTPKQ